jgi:hypothetical protein
MSVGNVVNYIHNYWEKSRAKLKKHLDTRSNRRRKKKSKIDEYIWENFNVEKKKISAHTYSLAKMPRRRKMPEIRVVREITYIYSVRILKRKLMPFSSWLLSL